MICFVYKTDMRKMLLARAQNIPVGSYVNDKNTDRYLFRMRMVSASGWSG